MPPMGPFCDPRLVRLIFSLPSALKMGLISRTDGIEPAGVLSQSDVAQDLETRLFSFHLAGMDISLDVDAHFAASP